MHGPMNVKDGGYITPRLSICPGALLIVTANYFDRKLFSAQFEVNGRNWP